MEEQYFERLKRAYRKSASRPDTLNDLRIHSGVASITVSVGDRNIDLTGSVETSFYFKTMADAALLAGESIAQNRPVTLERFAMRLIRPVEEGAVTATARVVKQEGLTSVVEVRLVDTAGILIAQGRGVCEFKLTELPEDESEAVTREPSSSSRIHASVLLTPFGIIHQN